MKDNLKICRKNKRMTTKEVSEKIGVSKQAIVLVNRLFIT